MKNKKPLVTVVTITYNLINAGRKEYFIQCLKSVHNQTYQNIEHIIIDGASNDGTIELIEKYSKKGWVTYISEKDDGIYYAMNKGIEMAKGKYLAFLNSDDYYYDINSVKLSIDALERDRASYSFANVVSINCDTDEVIGIWNGNIDLIPFGVHYCHQTMFVRKNELCNLDGFNTAYAVSADSDLMIRLFALNKKYVYVDKIIAAYRSGGLSNQNSKQCRNDHSLSFYIHVGKDCRLSFEDCKDMWNFSLLEEKNYTYNLRTAKKLEGFVWQGYLINRMYHYYKNKDVVFETDTQTIKSSKTYRLGDLFFRSIRKPHKLLTYPYNFARIVLEKQNNKK